MTTATVFDSDDQQAHRVAGLAATDPQFAAAQPDQAVADAAAQPGLRLPQLVQTILPGYADRPALGQRAVDFVVDPATGRTVAQLQPGYDTITYAELAERVRALAAALVAAAVRPGDRVAVLGFTSVDYTVIDVALGQIGAVSVPLQTSAAVRAALRARIRSASSP
jgi:fatty acid CoA ligase FadD9